MAQLCSSTAKLDSINSPFPRLAEEEASELRKRTLGEIFSSEGMFLQLKTFFHEKKVLVMLCWNDETRDSLRALSWICESEYMQGAGCPYGSLSHSLLGSRRSHYGVCS
ncbi:hypothetical protein J6590_070656 [Homalodisca vitripennis]|nr:hypothetical protein J6590_070656 [Homalodisca vitripennis]